LKQGYVEGSSYVGNFIVDYMNFQDEIAEFKSKSKADKDKQHSGIFGCVTSENGMFFEQGADGILGLGLSTNNTFPPDVIQIQRSQDRLAEGIFSLCFGHDGGYMTLGGYNRTKHFPEAQEEIFKYYPDNGQYRIVLNSVNVDGSRVAASKADLNMGQGVFIDSGTTVIHGHSAFIE
jgi:Eukaryotic aspartyl protease